MGAALGAGFSDELLEMFYEEFGLADWTRERGRSLPPCYAYSRRNRANPAAVRRMRRALSRVPRVNPEDYDILLNIEGSDWGYLGPTWDVVKWVRMPELSGMIPGVGFMVTIVEEPYPVYSIPATREPLSLSDHDWSKMLRNAVTVRGGDEISEELIQQERERIEERHRRRIDEDLDFAEYNRTRFRRIAEDLGI